jgi:hypothetical protein
VITLVQNEPGRYAPRIVCDHCWMPIEELGNAEWDMGEETPTIYHTHKRCTGHFRAGRPHVHTWGCEELDMHIALLVHNSKLDLKKGMERWGRLRELAL